MGEGWARVAVGKITAWDGFPMTMRLQGTVGPYLRGQAVAEG